MTQVTQQNMNSLANLSMQKLRTKKLNKKQGGGHKGEIIKSHIFITSKNKYTKNVREVRKKFK